MSVKIMGQVWDLELPASKLLVLLAMADHADHEGHNVYLSVELIAWKTGYSESQARRIMKSLVKDGILSAQIRPGRTTLYSIQLEKGKLKEPFKRSNTGRQNDTPVIAVTPQGLHSCDTPTPVIAMTPEPSLEPSITTISPVGDAKPRNLLFDIVALGSFGIQQVNGDKQAGARIGKIAAWLKKQADITPAEVTAFYGWYGRETKQSPPRDIGKFAEWFLKFREKGKPAKSIPVSPEMDLSIPHAFDAPLDRFLKEAEKSKTSD